MSWRRLTDANWEQIFTKFCNKLEKWSDNGWIVSITYLVMLIITGRFFYWFRHDSTEAAGVALLMAVFWPITVPGFILVWLFLAMIQLFIFLITF